MYSCGGEMLPPGHEKGPKRARGEEMLPPGHEKSPKRARNV